MSRFSPVESSGAPTFTAASASLSLSGLEQDFDPLVDPSILNSAANWFHGHSQQQQRQQQQQHEHGGFGFGGFASPGAPVSGPDAMQRTQYPALTRPMNRMNGIHQQLEHGAHTSPHLDDLGAISPLQTTYPPYTTPYPDSTASSAPSDDAVIAEADEDKRKRNQAASARFRQKKKQREQQMVEQSRELQDRTKKLEHEVDNLKRENTFLKKLLVEKVDNMSVDDKAQLAKTTGLDKKI